MEFLIEFLIKENQLHVSNGKMLYYYLQDQALGAACEQLITRNQAFIPAFVRLIFHDCVSGCDGCIDTTLTESTHGDVVRAGMVIKNTKKQIHPSESAALTLYNSIKIIIVRCHL